MEAAEFEKIIASQTPTEIELNLPTKIKIAAKQWGPSASPNKILAVHGWMDNANTFDLVAPFLAAHGFTVVAIDLVGHGQSHHLEACSDYSYYDYLCNIVDCAAVLKWKHFAYIGHSMGGALGVSLAAALPSTLTHLVIIDSLGPYVPQNASILRTITSALNGRQRFFNRKPHLYPSVAAAAEKLHNNNPSLSERGLNLLLERSLRTVITDGVTGVVYSHDPRLREPSPVKMHESDAQEMLRSIKCPIFVAVSNTTIKLVFDNVNATNRQQILKEKGTEVVFVDGSHHLHLDNPQAFAPQLLAFLNKIPIKPKL
eukprot:Phypoly_transcript_11052.p1 GENE.Phypoly_transcript_11052~~Phypoly_transcript_11052.p1  ORF type:complete len:314 (+),score=50.80 Phypoly_transcript_11052:148-1089(+)